MATVLVLSAHLVLSCVLPVASSAELNTRAAGFILAAQSPIPMSTATRSILVERGPVSLGCGTLILIALIVMFFSNANREDDTSKLEREVQSLQSQIGGLQDSIDHQTQQLSQLEQQIRRLQKIEVERPGAEKNAPTKE